MKRLAPEELRRCSFCHKPQDAVAKLIASPGELPRAYICDECVSVCDGILEEERVEKSINEQSKLARPEDDGQSADAGPQPRKRSRRPTTSQIAAEQPDKAPTPATPTGTSPAAPAQSADQGTAVAVAGSSPDSSPSSENQT